MMMYMLFPNAKRKALTFSYDDGVEQDARLMEIFNKHGLKGTFNLNSGLFTSEIRPGSNTMAVEEMAIALTHPSVVMARTI